MRFFAIAVCLIPSLAFGQWDMGSLEKRVSSLEDRVSKLEGKAKSKYCDCPCPDGVCVCPPGECPCPDCPKSNATTKHGAQWKGAKPTNDGLEVLYFGADWCSNCPAAIKRLGDTTKQIIYVDCTDDDTLASMYRVDAFPSLIAIRDGIKIDGKHTEGSSVGEFMAKRFLGETSSSSSNRTSRSVQSSGRSVSRYSGPTWTWPGDLRSHLESTHGISTSGLTQAQLRTIHDNLHNTRSSGIGRTSYTSSGSCPSGNCGGYSSGTNRTYYTPTVYYRSYGSCPTCR